MNDCAENYIALQAKLTPKTAAQNERGCCLWKGRKSKDGYGIVQVRKKDRGRMKIRAHRASFMVYRGEIPDGLCVLHTCDNPPCVNPDHLFLGTKLDNSQDMIRKGRQICVPREKTWAVRNPHLVVRGEASPEAKLTESQVRSLRAMYATGNFTFEALGVIFGIGHSSAVRAIKRQSWKHVE